MSEEGQNGTREPRESESTSRVEWLRELASWLERDSNFVAHLLQSAPDSIVVADADGHIILVNDQAELLTGYHRTEMIGHEVEMLIPQRLRKSHQGYRTEYLNDPHARPMGAANSQLCVQTKAGREVPVEISLSPVVTVQGIFVLTIIRRVRMKNESQGA